MTAFAIKMIAISSMLIDHAGVVFDLHMGTRMIGRLAFPLFVYLIASSCHHTKSMEKYLFRLGIFALISEVPFDLAFNEYIDFLNRTNIFYTLFLGVFCVYVFKQVRHKPYYLQIFTIIAVICAMTAASLLGTDFGPLGVLFVFLAAIFSEVKFFEVKYLQLGVIASFMYLMYFSDVYLLAASLVAVPVAAMASGKRGVYSEPVKWLFYWIYPMHLLVFATIAML